MSTSEALATAFRERGFVHLEGLLGPAEVDACVSRLERLSGRTRARLGRRRISPLPGGLRDAWAEPDGVSRHPEFWPLVLDEALLATVRAILGPDVRYLQHTDLHVAFSALTWHRDSVNRNWGEGEDWNEAASPYRLVRVGLYLQHAHESGFALGLIPGSHRPPAPGSELERRVLESRLGFMSQAWSWLTGRDALAERAEWLAPNAGDAILFDPRILHAGSKTRGPKYSVFFAYGVPGPHFDRHYTYYRHCRVDLGYRDLARELVERLRGAGLDPGPRPGPGAVEDAWLPPTLQRRLSRPFRARA